jgi:hypothetical protein
MIPKKLSVNPGDLVKMKLGFSGPGIVQEVMKQHPRADEEMFAPISHKLKKMYVKVFWTDEQESEVLPLEHVKVME